MAGYEPLSREELLGLLAERDARIAQLEAENAEQARAIVELREQVGRLTRIVSRNSGNSSMPPER